MLAFPHTPNLSIYTHPSGWNHCHHLMLKQWLMFVGLAVDIVLKELYVNVGHLAVNQIMKSYPGKAPRVAVIQCLRGCSIIHHMWSCSRVLSPADIITALFPCYLEGMVSHVEPFKNLKTLLRKNKKTMLKQRIILFYKEVMKYCNGFHGKSHSSWLTK